MSATLPEHDKPLLPAKLKVIAMDSSKERAVEKKEAHKNYKGFVAGVFSGVCKLTGDSLTHSRSFHVTNII
jgi:hypothetical protein